MSLPLFDCEIAGLHHVSPCRVDELVRLVAVVRNVGGVYPVSKNNNFQLIWDHGGCVLF